MEPWTRQLLAIIVSQICKTIGWHSISTTSLQILVDVLHRYLKRLGTNIHGYAEHLNHTHPALEEINLAFLEMGINVEDLKEYADYVSSIPLKTKVPKYPLEKKSNLNFLKPGSREVVTRPVHIHEHLPAMYPELSEENYGNLEPSPDDSLPSLNLETPSTTLFKKPENEVINNRRITQLISEEMGRPLRELSCVMMTTSGFLSPAREGKTAEARVPKLNNFTNVNPTQPSSYPTVPPEVKGDSKKPSHSTKIVNNSKAERKSRDEIHQNGKDNIDDSKIKKLATHKEVSKLKMFKSFHNKNNTDNDAPKIIRPEKIKVPPPVASPKEVKIPKPKIEKIPEKIPEPEIIVEEKLTTEPNKQKLNIFKRISKVKEERAESPVPKNTTPAEKNAQINECIEAVIKRSREKDEVEKINHKEEKHKPVVFEEPPPPAPTTPSTVKHLKRKKKQKHEVPAKKLKEINHEPEEIVEKRKPKMLEIESDVPLYSIMNDIHKTPGIIPASLTHNPLIPRFTPNPFLPGFSRFESNGPHPEMPNLPLPPAALMQANVDTKVKPSIKNIVEPEPKFEDEATTVVDKKLKKKMKKDKREKDKKKTKKDKLKNKEKLDKKKDKVLKKIKVKNKNKIKKEKKLGAEKKEIPVEDPSVPKLKLKLGNPNSPQLSPSGIQSPKIVIKPIVKHDDRIKSPAHHHREPSPELAKISALNSKPSKQKQSKIVPESPSTSFSKPVEPITISKNEKSSGNAKIKPKNKDKQKNKKTEEKAKPAAFYYDAEGNQVWVCPACGNRDDGSPMIGCDGCDGDAWYHWSCVGIKSAPDSAKWFCDSCAKAK